MTPGRSHGVAFASGIAMRLWPGIAWHESSATPRNPPNATFWPESAPDALQSDVLKIGHHGSKNSTSGAENPCGHPLPQLIERLQQAGIATVRPDTSGSHIFNDGKKLEVPCFVACPEIFTKLNSAKPQSPQDEQASQQQ